MNNFSFEESISPIEMKIDGLKETVRTETTTLQDIRTALIEIADEIMILAEQFKDSG